MGMTMSSSSFRSGVGVTEEDIVVCLMKDVEWVLCEMKMVSLRGIYRGNCVWGKV